MYRDYFTSPLGLIELAANEAGITRLDFCEKRQRVAPHPLLASISHHPPTATAQWHALPGFPSVGALEIESTMPARSSVAKASHAAPLNRLATNGGGKYWLEQAKLQLKEYFKGERQQFDLKLEMHGTAFQKSVWEKLLDIPFGETCSYHDIAKRIGNPKAVRAVGAANGKNPIALIVPCHRVIGSNGGLTGYAGGLARKSWLLQHEASVRISHQDDKPLLDL